MDPIVSLPRAPLHDVRGVMLAEVLIATAILVAAGSGAIQLTTTSLRRLATAGVETATSLAASGRLEQLRSLTWTIDGAGTPHSDATSRLAVDPPDGAGTGLAPSPAGTLDSNVDGFVDYLDAHLNVVGTGTVPPAGSVYVRRWAIVAHPDDPDHTRVLQVLVIPVAASAEPRTPGRRGPGEALLTTVITRVSR
jgi:hypothetical protein